MQTTSERKMVFVEEIRDDSLGSVRTLIIGALSALPSWLARPAFFLLTIGSKRTRMVLNHPGTWKALEPMYTFPRRKETSSFLERFWFYLLDNVQSIPLRLDVVKELVKDQVLKKGDGTVHILSIGSGSSRPVQESLSELGSPDSVRAMLIDMDSDAIRFSEQLSVELGVNHSSRHVGNFFRLGSEVEQELRDFQPNVVELVGLLDYLDDKIARVLLKKVARVMHPDGILITGNILPNRESGFVTKGIRWPMVYRTPEQLCSVLEQSGFECLHEEQVLGIHSVVTARKTP